MTQKVNRIAVFIDPQNMFMPNLRGDMPLPVQGADEDMKRAAAYLMQYPHHYDAIVVTLDTHPADHIAHAIRWRNSEGECPSPFTVITSADYEAGLWRAANEDDAPWQGEYLKLLEMTGRVHTIWPTHGVEGHVQHEVYHPLRKALRAWQIATGKKVQFIKKGMHRDTEQFGVFAADVPIEGAPETSVNMELVDYINSFDIINVFGEASSHCVMDSVKQFMDNVNFTDWSKITVFRDCMSPVAAVTDPETGEVIVDFPAQADAWFAELVDQGVLVDRVKSRMVA